MSIFSCRPRFAVAMVLPLLSLLAAAGVAQAIGGGPPLRLSIGETPDAPSAQAATAADTGETVRFLVPASDSTQPPRRVEVAQLSSLRREIALDLRGATREHALAEIGRLTGMSIVYASDAIPRGAPVTLANRAISVGAALETVLAGASLDVLIGEHGTVVLLARSSAVLAPRFATVDGVVVDSVTGRPIRLVAVRVVGSGETVLTNNAGQFHLNTQPGELALNIRRIGFRPVSLRVQATPGPIEADVSLAPNPIGLDPIVVGGQSSASIPDANQAAARALVAAAIDRQRDDRTAIRDYRYDAHLVYLDRVPRPAGDSTPRILFIRESVLNGYWDAAGGGREQQTIVARRRIDPQQPNIRFDWESFQRVPRFDGSRWPLFTPQGISMISPIGDDALNHYAFAILDTLIVDGHRAFRLAVTPAAAHQEGFDGTIDIADSTFEVLGVDVGVDRLKDPSIGTADRDAGFEVSSARLSLRFADVGGGHRMLSSIAMTLNGLLLGIVSTEHAYTVVLGNYRFNQGNAPPGIGSFPLVVTPEADDAPATAFAAAPAVGAVGEEAKMLATPDSLRPRRSFSFHLGPNTMTDITFSRVDGWGWGLGGRLSHPAIAPWMTPSAEFGHALGTHRATYRLEDQVMVWPLHRLSVDAVYDNQIVNIPVFASENYNPTLAALFAGAGADQLDHYREHGFSGTLSAQLIGPIQASATYSNLQQSSTPLLARYATSPGGWLGLIPPLNPAIADGRLRAVSEKLTYDSRPLVLEPHTYERLDEAGAGPAGTFTRIEGQAEQAAPNTFGGDFDYRRYTVRVERQQQTWQRATTDIVALAGWSTGDLPPQQYFEINGGAALASKDAPYAALGSSILGGDRAAAIVVTHELGPAFPANTGIPLLRSLPFTFAVRGAAYWSTFNGNDVAAAAARAISSAPRGYREVGMSVTYPLPVIPIGITLRVDRELSRSPIRGLRLTIGF